MEFQYKRNSSQSDNDILKDHMIMIYESYGERFDDTPSWTHYRLKNLYDNTHQKLSNILKTAIRSRQIDLSNYKEDYAKQKKQEMLEQANKELLYTLKTEIESANANVQNLEHKILSYTEHKPNDNEIADIKEQMQYQEIRQHFSGLSIDRRDYELQKAFDNNDIKTIKALSSSPIALVDPTKLNKLRFQYALSNNKQLNDAYNDAKFLANIVRKKAASINATAQHIMKKEELDYQPSMKDHFETFPARDEHEKWAADRLLAREERAIMAQENKQRFEKENTGISM